MDNLQVNLQDNRSPQLVAVAAAFLAMIWITVPLRCFVRIFIMKQFQLDDMFLVAALVRIARD